MEMMRSEENMSIKLSQYVGCTREKKRETAYYVFLKEIVKCA